MAIIKGAQKFENSELGLNNGKAPYLRDNVKRVAFSKTENQQGVYLFFLPAYAADRNGNGMWYKKITIRSDFGTNFKDKYFVPNIDADPVEYFARNCKILFPDAAAMTTKMVGQKEFKVHPAFGRLTNRVLYNVAYAANPEKGVHVLDLPLRNGADILMNWLEGRDITGQPRPMVNDPDRAIPVFVQLKENSQNPWSISVESGQFHPLPVQLADSDYLYNLDTSVLVVKSNEELIAKLREIYHPQMFDACMDGFPGLTKSAVPGFSAPAASFNPPTTGFSASQLETPQPPQAAPQVARPSFQAPQQQFQPQQPQFSPAQPQAQWQQPQQTIDAGDQIPMHHAPQPPLPMPTQPVVPPPAAPVPVAAIQPSMPPAADIGGLPRNPMARMSREQAAQFMAENN